MSQSQEERAIRRHATAVSVAGEGVLLLGEPSSGKSDLAARLIHGGATLIADDQVDLQPAGESIRLNPPPTLAGVLELYGIGLISLPYTKDASLRLVVHCVPGLPERHPNRRKWIMEGIAIDEITLDALHPSSPAKIALLIRAMQSGQWLPEDWMADSQPAYGFSSMLGL